MAAVVADSTDKKGRSTKFVIGVQRPSSRSVLTALKLCEPPETASESWF